MYVFMTDNLALDNQLVHPLLGKTTSLSPSFPTLPTVLCARLKPRGFIFCLLWHVHWCHPCSAHALEVMLVRIYLYSF